MMESPMLALWTDGQIAEVFNSPFIVPVAGCAMIAGISMMGIWSGVRNREIRSQERLTRIAHGLPVEPEMPEAVAAAVGQAAASASTAAPNPGRRPNDGAGARRAGMVLSSIGLGLILFFTALAIIVQTREVMAGSAAGLIPLAIGVGFLIDARMRKREYDRMVATRPAFGAAGSGMGDFAAQQAAPLPPPPMGMSSAQASDWRPLH